MIPSTKPPKHLKMRAPLSYPPSRRRDLGPPKIEIQGLNFYYGEMRSLHNINLALADNRSARSSDRPVAENQRCFAF